MLRLHNVNCVTCLIIVKLESLSCSSDIEVEFQHLGFYKVLSKGKSLFVLYQNSVSTSPVQPAGVSDERATRLIDDFQLKLFF